MRDDVDWDAVIREYVDGATGSELAEKYGVSTPTVLSRVRAAGVARRRGPRQGHGSKRMCPDRDAAIAARRRSGETLQSIGDEYGLTRERVRQICQREGVPAAQDREDDR